VEAIVLAKLQPPQELLVAVADHELSPPLFSPPIQTDWKLRGAVWELMEPQANLQFGKGLVKPVVQPVAVWAFEWAAGRKKRTPKRHQAKKLILWGKKFNRFIKPPLKVNRLTLNSNPLF
jgi:hypothetical protein